MFNIGLGLALLAEPTQGIVMKSLFVSHINSLAFRSIYTAYSN